MDDFLYSFSPTVCSVRMIIYAVSLWILAISGGIVTLYGLTELKLITEKHGNIIFRIFYALLLASAILPMMIFNISRSNRATVLKQMKAEDDIQFNEFRSFSYTPDVTISNAPIHLSDDDYCIMYDTSGKFEGNWHNTIQVC